MQGEIHMSDKMSKSDHVFTFISRCVSYDSYSQYILLYVPLYAYYGYCVVAP